MKSNVYKARVGLILPALNRVADRSEGIFLVALQVWMDFAHKQIRRDLTEKYIKKDVTTELTDWEFIEGQGNEILKPATLKIMQRGGGQAYRILQAQVSFDVLNPEAVKAAGKLTANLVREVTQKTREGIRSHIKAGVKAGKSMDKIARDLKKVVGLTQRQVESIGGYRKLLEEKRPDLSAAQRDKRINTLTNKTHRRRMKTIARTETARAQSVGYAVGLEDLGVDQVEFQIHPDEKTCDECLGRDGKKYKVGEGGYEIPVHPNCRCCLLPVIADTPTCRMAKRMEKATCVPPDSLHDEQIKDLLERLKRATPDRARKLRRALRRLGHKGGLGGKPPVTTIPRVKPTKPVVAKPKPKPKFVKPKVVESGEGISNKASGGRLTAADKQHFDHWIMEANYDVVKAQLGKTVKGGYLKSSRQALAFGEKMEKALLKLPGHRGTSYRGLYFTSRAQETAYLARFQERGIIQFRAFQTSSTKKLVSNEFISLNKDRGVMLKILGRSGRSIVKHVPGANPGEILFLKSSRFRVLKTAKKGKLNHITLQEI